MFRSDRPHTSLGLFLAVVALAAAAADYARAQTVEFAIDSLSVSESDAYAVLPVTISQAPAYFAYVAFNTASGTADGGLDFTVTGGSLTWYGGDGDPRAAWIGILQDFDPEPNETFTVELSNPLGEATLGSRTTITVTIVDDDTGQVFLDVADAFYPATGKSYWLLPGPEADVPARLSAPAGSGGVAAGFSSTLTPTSGPVPFAEGEQTSTIHLDFPGGDSQTDGTWIGDVGELDLVTAPPGMNLGIPGSLVMAWVRPAADRSVATCVMVLDLFLCQLFNPGDPICGSGAADGASPLATLQRYRDEVLNATGVGQLYVALYDTHSPGIIDAMFASPSLAFRTIRAQGPWIEAIDALVNGNGDSATVTSAMQSDLLTLLDAYSAFGGSALASMIAAQRTQLQLDSIAGLTMTQFQQQIETLGGISAVHPTSWSRVKSMYRSAP